jgi:predicted subunit of tRNA(5-methylaminomethyl-2-thiouridylate) methyltransferase
VCEKIRNILGGVLNEADNRWQIEPKGRRTHPQQVALIVNVALPQKCLSFLHTLAVEMLASDSTVQVVARVDLLAGW